MKKTNNKQNNSVKNKANAENGKSKACHGSSTKDCK